LSDVKVKLGGKSAADAFDDRIEAMAMLTQAIALDHTGAVNTLRAVCGYR
jgi:hypothetical protein